MLLFDLPKELLLKVFELLDFESIKALYSIPQFEQGLQGFVTIVSDLDEAAATSWLSPSCPYVNLKKLTVGQVKSGYVLYVLENCLNSELVQKIIANQERPNTVILSNKLMKSVSYEPKKGEDFYEYDSALLMDSSKDPVDTKRAAEFFESDAYRRYKEVSYKNVEKLIALLSTSELLEYVECPYLECVELTDLKFDAMKFRTPNVKAMLLYDCINTNSSAKLNFPVLAELTFDGFCKSFIDCMDLENCPAESLTVEGGDIVKWENLVVGKAKTVSISISDELERPILGSFGNISVPCCEDLSLGGFIDIFNVSAPLVSKLNIGSTYATSQEHNFSLKNFQADKVKTLSMGSHNVAEFSTALFESVLVLELCDTKFLCSGIFGNVKELKISSDLASCFQMIDTKTLTSLEVTYELFEESETDDLSRFSFPTLEKVKVIRQHEFGFLKTLNAPNIEELHFHRPSSTNFFDILSNGFENLQKLRVTIPSFPTMEGIRLENLNVIDIVIGGLKDKFKIVSCSFPNLHAFYLRPLLPQVRIVPKGNIDIEAPKLETFHSTHLKMDHLNLTKFPELIELKVNYVEKITLGDVAESLIAFEVHGNSLQELSYSKAPENLHHFDEGCTSKNVELEQTCKLFEIFSRANQLLLESAIMKRRRHE
ncbi:hypothetical protein WICANDRAFT_76961 [Wickerhamomyces anomalus NRRL Y-366-8]|uniref:F-box domain-containing protein n=1 Tax=Wickerhamomyces anomalus (strain ATCC 58044 / CBS 1984 / NCYC 433 / NRRL Y-366-8) TaxID=683960 RepID=A0A1E3PBK5_WICAA|nr:uncharacterized protein WICANDRAFT_76961 [Wickerhamomyces anomalus NRRL Y-366-8]ODQ62799.1 hypothetical protein WICANDRAFT_76961 [Wickerhamomyces anomalus NRRL Y-366-8]